MAYQKTRWVNNETPLNEGNLNKLEQGVKDAHDDIEQHQNEIDNVKDTVYNDHAERISLNETRIEELYSSGGSGGFNESGVLDGGNFVGSEPPQGIIEGGNFV